MTHADHTRDEELYAGLRRALDSEPPMTALPDEDLARGRRRLRLRRAASVVAAAAAVPAVALVASTLPSTTTAQPMDSPFASGPAATEDDEAMGTLEAECVEASGRMAGGSDIGSAGSATRKERLGFGGRLQTSRGVEGPQEPGADCEAVPVEPVQEDGVVLEQVLFDVLDPSGEHLSTVVAGVSVGAVSEAGGGGDGDGEEETLVQTSVSADWMDGERLGGVDLSVADPRSYGGELTLEPCEDPGLVGGPPLTCERRELADGTIVLIGTGERDGVQRVTVRYEQDTGELVWATADEASDTWWEDGSGAQPLDHLPATVDQLVEVVRDPRTHL